MAVDDPPAGRDQAGRIESEGGERRGRLPHEHLLGRTGRSSDVPQALDRMHEPRRYCGNFLRRHGYRSPAGPGAHTAQRRASRDRRLGHAVPAGPRRARPVHVRERVAARGGRPDPHVVHRRRRARRLAGHVERRRGPRVPRSVGRGAAHVRRPQSRGREGAEPREPCRRSSSSTWPTRSKPSPKAGTRRRGARPSASWRRSSSGRSRRSPARARPARTPARPA